MIWKKLRLRLRWATLQGQFALGGGKRVLRDRPGLRVLIYHGVVPAPVRRINARFVSTEQLEAQLAYVKLHFQTISLDQAFARDYDPKRMAVAITFDDGYRNNLKYALPILQKHALPATFFVSAPRAAGEDILWADILDIASARHSSGLVIGDRRYQKNGKGEYIEENGERLKDHCKIGGPAFTTAMKAALAAVPFRQDNNWDDYWQLMDAAEVTALASEKGMTMGGHGTLHHNLDRLPISEAMRDVMQGIQWLEKATGKPIRSFAYPDGAYSPELVEALAAKGIQQQILSEYRFQDADDPRLLERFTVHPYLPTKVLIAEMLRGGYF
jgi:peptidoglycan/xylan/chitin deacetylase (PgdA/CDA1 family)